MKRRKTKKVKMVRILGETVRKGSKSYRILLAERQRFLARQRDPQSSYYKVPISELLKSNRRRGLRRNSKATDGMTPREKLRYHVSGAIERGEGKAIAGMPMEYARQIPLRDRPMRGRGFDKRFDVSAGSDYNDLYKIVTEGKYRGARKIGDNTFLNLLSDQTIIVRLYGTPILTYRPNGEVDVNFGGYMTKTTFSRINNLIPYGWNLRNKGGQIALENSWGKRAIIRKPIEGEEYGVRLTSDKAYLIV